MGDGYFDIETPTGFGFELWGKILPHLNQS